MSLLPRHTSSFRPGQALRLSAFLLALSCTVTPGVSELTGTLPSGEQLSLLGAEQRAAVLVFVAPDCPISNRYVPTYNRLEASFRSSQVALYLVYSDDTFSNDQIAEHRSTYEIAAPALVDHDQRLQKLVGAQVTPEAFLLDPQARVRYSGRVDDRWVSFGRFRPKPSDESLTNAVNAFLDGRPIDPDRTEAIGCYLPELP